MSLTYYVSNVSNVSNVGDGFKTSMFKLCRRFIRKEGVPSRFFQTKLHQLWKKKYPKENLKGSLATEPRNI